MATTSTRLRREPPSFRRAEVRATERLTPRLVRVTLGGQDLAGFEITEPAASVRLLLPPAGTSELVMPEWNGNEFLLPGGDRPTIRTLTPRRADPAAGTLVVDVVIHAGGTLAAWADHADAGAPAAISGPGRGYEIDASAPDLLLAGDETAIPAICQLLEWLPAGIAPQVIVEVADPAARLDLHEPIGATVRWCELPAGAPHGDALVAAVRDADLPADARVWAAGEAAAMQRIRRHLFDDRGMSRRQATVRGYWKYGRRGDPGDD